MIHGIGNDIIEIERIKKVLDRHPASFLNRVFTSLEQSYCLQKKEPARHLAARFAAKEAVAKAFGSGFSQGLTWTDIEIVNDSQGKPNVQLSFRAKQRFKGAEIHLSMSHCNTYATAMAIYCKISLWQKSLLMLRHIWKAFTIRICKTQRATPGGSKSESCEHKV